MPRAPPPRTSDCGDSVTDPKQRFSDRAENYAAYRPGYPRSVLDLLETECGLSRGSVIADIASGTGFLSGLFLGYGSRVYGVEPNDEMRLAGERSLETYPGFTSVAGTAEATMLGDDAADFVVVGHAFHWFDPGPTRAEFTRILRPEGWVALLWNEQRTDATPFLAAYESLIQRYKTERYKPFDMESEVRSFFAPEPFENRSFENRQTFGLDGLKGRLLSSSYAPDKGQPGHGAMMEELESIFQDHQENGRVTVEYDTLVYYGRLR